ncbi:glycosyltransferase [Kineococcus sp. SYSU DK002]|uniref:glycosyltransferase n=1 Tax=Kineococcus sp. SYSU DK002 TaxID=3383123 RepID=UPI003D7D9562
MGVSRTPGFERVRLYRTLRTAHLEQALQLHPAVIVYSRRRYDFDDALAARLDLVHAGPWRAAALLLRRGAAEVEVNEPLMRMAVRATAVAVAAARVRGLLTGRQPRLVSYGIENLDPFGAPRDARAALAAHLDRALTRFVWGQLDRFVYGTEAARDLYARLLPPFGDPAGHRLLPTLPQPCDCPPAPRDRSAVLFLGAFSPRKGFGLLREAWPAVRDAAPGAHLHLAGQGAQAAEAAAWAEADRTVELSLDPPRPLVHAALRRAQVLVLPSQPQPGWREQLGLPLTEALAHGCTVVTTDETGLAPWLRAHGHTVVPAGGSPGELAGAVAAALRAARPAAGVLADLPARDGRLAADDWLFAPSPR